MCPATADDERGVPHGCYVINGLAIDRRDLVTHYACPVCLGKLHNRIVDGKSRVFCDQDHDIAELGRAVTLKHAEYVKEKQRQDYLEAFSALPEELRRTVLEDPNAA